MGSRGGRGILTIILVLTLGFPPAFAQRGGRGGGGRGGGGGGRGGGGGGRGGGGGGFRGGGGGGGIPRGGGGLAGGGGFSRSPAVSSPRPAQRAGAPRHGRAGAWGVLGAPVSPLADPEQAPGATDPVSIIAPALAIDRASIIGPGLEIDRASITDRALVTDRASITGRELVTDRASITGQALVTVLASITGQAEARKLIDLLTPLTGFAHPHTTAGEARTGATTRDGPTVTGTATTTTIGDGVRLLSGPRPG
jgi:hypothetical protein